MFRALLLLVPIAALAACTSSDLPPEPSSEARDEAEASCDPGDEQECACGKQKGVSVCAKSGTYGACRCASTALDDGGSKKPDGGAVRDDGDREDDEQEPSASDAAAEEPNDKSPMASALPCEVRALLAKHCGKCHGTEPEFGAPMPLVSWDDLHAPAPKARGKKTFQAVLERVRDDQRPMPPAPGVRLSSAEIATLSAWIESGAAKESGARCEPLATTPSEPSEPSGVAKPADCDQTFELRAHGAPAPDDKSKFKISATPALEGNQYHCFFFDPPYTSDAAMFWYQPIIDNRQSIHHWILYATDNKTHPSGTSAACNAAEPGAYFVAGWAPGADNTTLADDVALQLPSGPRGGLILEVHYYNNTGKPQEDGSGIRFCTGKKSRRAHLAGVHTLGSEGICLNPGVDSEVAGTCAPRQDRGDVHIVGVWPHMHKLARRMKLTVKRKGGGSEIIHDAPFDFNAQIFHNKSDVVIRAGDSIETRCYFRNDTGTKVHYGERTQDEMCYAFVMAWPAGSLVSPPSPLANPSTELLNRCADPLSILQSCNGINDRPMTVDHP